MPDPVAIPEEVVLFAIEKFLDGGGKIPSIEQNGSYNLDVLLHLTGRISIRSHTSRLSGPHMPGQPTQANSILTNTQDLQLSIVQDMRATQSDGEPSS